MRSPCLLVAVVVCLPQLSRAQTNETVVPAGTILQCTLDEPRFSSATAQVGEPVVCHVNSLGMFGRPVFDRGAYLSGRLKDFRDPGHFVGKGWLRVEFDSLTSSSGTVPIAARIVSVTHYRVDIEGKIRGHGHARRDAIEWSLPILWPEKVITLPARGPRPELKGETRISLRILEDVPVPNNVTSAPSAAAIPTPLASRVRVGVNPGVDSRIASSPSNSGFSRSASVSSSIANGIVPRIRYGGATALTAKVELPPMNLPNERQSAVTDELTRPIERFWRDPKSTLLVRKDGRAYVVTNYWFEAGLLVYFASDGRRQTLPPEALDFETTVKVNQERGVPFVIRSNPSEP
jgi:hypothetical protein